MSIVFCFIQMVTDTTNIVIHKMHSTFVKCHRAAECLITISLPNRCLACLVNLNNL